MTTTDTPTSTPTVDMPTISVADQVVAVGAGLLDAEQPGWHTRIDITTLRMRSFTTCILGQLYGSFEEGVEALWPDLDWINDADAMYATTTAHGLDTDADASFEQLDEAWLTAINARRWSATPGNLTAVTS